MNYAGTVHVPCAVPLNGGECMTKQSTMKPFAAGDIFLGCTYLCDPDDDHKGDGRILQYDRNMVPKGTLYTEGTSRLIVNLRFAPDGTLWAFDPFEYAVIRVSPEGRQLDNIDFGERVDRRHLFFEQMNSKRFISSR